MRVGSRRRANGPPVIRALVSIGTNSTRLLVLDGELRVAGESRGTRIGTGIGATGSIDPTAAQRTLAAVDDYVAIARRRGATVIDTVATSALRRARDGASFGAEVGRRTGIAPRVLSGAEEATYSFLGSTAPRAREAVLAALAIGGATTEPAVDRPSHARTNAPVERTRPVWIG